MLTAISPSSKSFVVGTAAAVVVLLSFITVDGAGATYSPKLIIKMFRRLFL
jgi:hypothetical protein